MARTFWLTIAVLLLPLFAPAAESPDPRMGAIIENAIRRDRLFDRIEARVTLTLVKGNDQTPQATASGHWFKDGDKALGDYNAVFNEPEGQRSLHATLSFDGKVVRIMNYSDRSGEVRPGARAFYHGGDVAMFPDSLGVQNGGARVCDLLQGITMPDNGTDDDDPVDHKVTFIGNEMLDGQNCVVIDVFTEAAGASHGKRRFYLGTDLGYAPIRIDQWQRADSERPFIIQTLSKFTQAPDGTWYATEGRLEGLEGSMVLGYATLTLDEIAFPSTIDQAVFDLQFPAGTLVNDSVAHMDYIVGESPSSVTAELETTTSSLTPPSTDSTLQPPDRDRSQIVPAPPAPAAATPVSPESPSTAPAAATQAPSPSPSTMPAPTAPRGFWTMPKFIMLLGIVIIIEALLIYRFRRKT